MLNRHDVDPLGVAQVVHRIPVHEELDLLAPDAVEKKLRVGAVSAIGANIDAAAPFQNIQTVQVGLVIRLRIDDQNIQGRFP